MKQIDESQLEVNLVARWEYLADFMGFTAEDAAAIQASAPFVGPLIPDIVHKTYEKLLAYDATARHFVPRQAGFEGPTPSGVTGSLANHPQVQFRKEHLARYFMQVLGRNCDEQMVRYLDMVGKIHTTQAGNQEIDVPLVQMNALLGYLSDVLYEIIVSLPLDATQQMKTWRAFNKFLWIQNDFVNRHYQQPREV